MICLNINSYIDFHVALFARIFDVDIICVTQKSYQYVDYSNKSDLLDYYIISSALIYQLTYKTLNLFDTDICTLFEMNCIMVKNPDILQNLTTNNQQYKRTKETIREAEQEMFTFLCHNKLISFHPSIVSCHADILAACLKMIHGTHQNRDMVMQSYRVFTEHNMTLFQWILFALTHNDSSQLHKFIKFHSITEPRIAIVLYGNTFKSEFHQLTNNPNADIFISVPSLLSKTILDTMQPKRHCYDPNMLIEHILDYESCEKIKYDIIITIPTNSIIKKALDWKHIIKASYSTSSAQLYQPNTNIVFGSRDACVKHYEKSHQDI